MNKHVYDNVSPLLLRCCCCCCCQAQYNISVREIFQSVLPSVVADDASEIPDCAGYDPLRPTRVFATAQ
jgi:hypothetical protein